MVHYGEKKEKTMNRGQMIRGYLLVIFSAAIFGCMPLMVKSIYADGMNALSVVLFRNLLSLPVVGILAYCRNGGLRIPAKALPSIASIGIMGCCVAPVLLFSSYVFIASGTASVLHFVYPAAVVLGGILFYREKATAGNLICMLICVAGMALFYTPGEPLDWRGVILAVVSGFAYAAYILQLSHFRYPEISGFLLNFYIFLINSLVMLVICAASGMVTVPSSPGIWVLCFFFAIVINVCAVAMFQWGTRIIGGQQAAILSTMEPITGVFVGILVFREAMTLRTALGSVLVLLASILIVVSNMHSGKDET